MDTTSIVTSRPALADGETGLKGPAHLRARHGVDLQAVINQPNPLDSAAQSYQGGAVVTLDFAPEVERPKATGSTCPTTT